MKLPKFGYVRPTYLKFSLCERCDSSEWHHPDFAIAAERSA